jgi:hypothetical protein
MPLNRNPHLLGNTCDTHHNSTQHIKGTAPKAFCQVNIMKALSGTSFGKQKECLLATYKGIVRPTFTHATPIWFPNASKTALNSLQLVQNAGLRIVMGCHKKTAIGYLHHETKVMSVANHLQMLCFQFLANTL